MKGKKIKVKFIEDEHRGRKSVKASQRVGGRYSFPDRRGPQPQPGEIWEVEVAGENSAGSVYFLRCLKRISTEAERKEATKLARKEQEALWQRQQSLRPVVQGWLNKFSQWDVKNHSFELAGIEMILSPKVAGFTSDERGLVLQIEPRVLYLGSTAVFEKTEVVIPWSDLKVEKVYLREPEQWRQVTATVATAYGRFDLFFAPYAGEVRFVSWDQQETALKATVEFGLNGVQDKATFTVAEFTVKEGKGKIAWKVNDYSRQQMIQADHYLPEVSPEHLDWLNALLVDHESFGQQVRSVGLLAIVSENPVGAKLREFFAEHGYGGVGFSPRAKRGENYVIHPDLACLFQDLPNVALVQAKMRDQEPEEAWQAIVWDNGLEPPSPAVIESLLSETTEVEEMLDTQDWLAEYGRKEKPLPCTIVCEELETPYTGYSREPQKFVFHAKVATPCLVKSYRKHTFSAYNWDKPPVLEERVEFKPAGHTFEAIAYGNERFEGESELEVRLVKVRKSLVWRVFWNAPKTKEEMTERKVEAIREVIRYGREYQAILTGWRWFETGNPVIYVRYDNNIWRPCEFDRETFSFFSHKGYGSRKGDFYSDQTPTARQIQVGLESLVEYGWKVEAEEDWQAKAGKSVLSIFPEALIKKIEGGV